MIPTSPLDLAYENASSNLHEALTYLGASGDILAEAHFAAGKHYRTLAICRLLQGGPVKEYAGLFAMSGHARLALLRVGATGATFHSSFLCASKDLGFASALAAGDLETARAIADLSARQHYAGLEYEDDFLFVHFLHRCMMGDEPRRLEELLSRWELVLEGAESGYLAVCRALGTGTAADFPAAFGLLIDHRKRQLARYRQALTFNAEKSATEGRVFVEGLAVLRLAELASLPTPAECELIPLPSRIPLGTLLPAADEWRKPAA